MRVIAMLLASLVAAPAGAEKCAECQCVGYLGALRRRPDPKDVALNARVRNAEQSARPGGGPPRLVLRARGGAEVPVASRRLRIDGFDHVELTPTGGLAPDTDYELVMLRDGHTIELQKLRTSDGRDTTPPAWEGIKELEYRPPDPCKIECRWRRDATLEIRTEPPKDDRSGAGFLALWLARDGRALDYRRAPDVYLTVDEEGLGSMLGDSSLTLHVGGDGPCDQGNLQLPRGARRLRVGMKAIDRAGNESEASEATIAIPGGITKPGW